MESKPTHKPITLSIALYGCETQCLRLHEEYRLQVFQTKSEGKYLGLVKNKYWCEIFQDLNEISYTNLHKNDVDTLISNSLMQCVTDMM